MLVLPPSVSCWLSRKEEARAVVCGRAPSPKPSQPYAPKPKLNSICLCTCPKHLLLPTLIFNSTARQANEASSGESEKLVHWGDAGTLSSGDRGANSPLWPQSGCVVFIS